MIKPNRGRGRGRGRGAGRGRRNASSNRGAQAGGTPSKQESENKREQTLEFTNELAFMACAPHIGDITLPLESPRILTQDDKDGQNSDLKTQEAVKTHASMPMSQESDKKQPDLDLKASKEHEELSSSNEKKATETKSAEDVSMPVTQDSEESEKQELNLDLNASKEHEEFSSDNNKKATETKSEDVSMLISERSEEFVKQELNLDLKASKERDEFSSGNEKKVTETKSAEDVTMPVSQDSEESEKQKLNLDLNASKEHEEFSSDNNKKENETKSEVNVPIPISQASDKQGLNLDLKASKEHQEISSDIERERARSKTDESESSLMLLGSKDVDWRNLDLETSHVQQELSESQFPVDNESRSSLQDSNLTALKEGIQNLNLNASNAKRDSSSKNQNELSESKTKQIINVDKAVNLRFESDALGNKKVLVDDEKEEYVVDKKKKTTFIIGDSNVKLSFHDNKVSIFAERGTIQCSKFENEVAFFIKASATKPESSTESPNTAELLHIKGTEAVKDLDNLNVTGMTQQDSLQPSEEMSKECGAKKVELSNLKADSPLVPRSEVQERLRSRTDAFLSNLFALCNDYESDFLKCLNKKKEDSTKE